MNQVIMIENGKVVSIYQEKVEDRLKQQVKNLLRNPALRNATIELMPDAHPGKFFPVGLYIEGNIKDGIMPSLIGNDAGCGTSLFEIEKPKRGFNFDAIDNIIKEKIPTGRNNHKLPQEYDDIEQLDYLHANIDKDLATKALGTLGSGNHYIEIDKYNDRYFLIVHSGSRYLGNAILEHWLDVALKDKDPNDNNYVYELGVLKNPRDIREYLHDILIAYQFAFQNRLRIANTIIKEAKLKRGECFGNYTHNDILNINDKYRLYKGAIRPTDSPIPSFPGLPASISLLGTNPAEGHILVDTTLSNTKALPHGSGRSLARSEVANSHTVNEFKKDMQNIHCTTICKDNLDECPKAYRSREYLINAIEGYELGKVLKTLEPVYVYKPME